MRSMIAYSVSSRLPLEHDGSSTLPLSLPLSTTFRSRAMASGEISENTWSDGRYTCGACRKPLANRSTDGKRISPAHNTAKFPYHCLQAQNVAGGGLFRGQVGQFSQNFSCYVGALHRKCGCVFCIVRRGCWISRYS